MTRALAALLLFYVLAVSSGAPAHEVRPAYLDLRQTGPETYDVLWKVPGAGDDLRLALQVEFPAGTKNATAPRGTFVNRAYTERWSVQHPGGLDGGDVRVAGLEATVTDALVRVQRLDGSVQTARLTPAAPSFVIETSPKWNEVARTYLTFGIEHILFGYDHLLFVLALVLVVPNRRLLVLTVTAFTIAHSITLGLATLGYVHVPRPPVEAAIALSVLLLATEIVRIRRGEPSLAARKPWAIAFAFGLLHGFGFAGALADAGLPQTDIPLALVSFNAGVELGQLAFIGCVLSVMAMVRQLRLPAIVVSRMMPVANYAIGITAAFWFIDRVAGFWS